ncbi:murein biosynthesis integral membrane protein MurJ [Clostridium beijerinckii]|uniref:Probable lipid II flippase MurJ n=1 Tax=Clostridium beijerinckii TaxID=1520 RepID=A0AAW3W9Y8_CLOBE|nr:murein biosynthesis integral membrane protein MurJ [Clostridium beijerinckii]MBC2457713.1 murein biosynthesis integral membrane protein MurJ [Clostridium beijerinckii]MBC2475639.1 murein biosynthesis integral membrane protein MurJ [Clostridium beijerinckii]NOV58424.1 putative peptidoglycan lipid II flippase [Clostridium beijerinckii]NOV72195.1 putative peptidoglycan lipid II flippase [Clostridium beijerinckii]NOW31779.1 putative peptidoglycan lipid II flippase [Clostridium beijerinckii]
MKQRSSLIKSTFIIMIVSLISRFLGFARDMLIAKNFGAGIYTDAYNIAVSIPETIFTLVGLAISTAFLPMLSKVRAEKGQKEMYDFANNIINILFIISFFLFVITSLFSKEIVHILGPAEETGLIAIKLLRITLVNILFLSVNACFTALLQVNEDFVIPSILGLFFNLPMILYLLLFRNYDILGLTIANVIGNFFRVAVQVPSLITHEYKYKLFINFKDDRLKAIMVLILPVIIGAGANSLNMAVDQYIALKLPDGSVSALNYAQKLIVFINAIITTSVTSVAYPLMANMRNRGDVSGFLEILKKSIIYLSILLIPISVGVMIFSRDIITIVYARGEFTGYAINITTLALLGYGAGIFFTGVRDILNSTLFSSGKTKVTAINGIIGVVINIIFSITLSKYIGIMGIALASVIAMIVTSVLLFINIIKLEKSFNITEILKKVSIIIMNSIIMGTVLLTLLIYFKNKFNSITILLLGASIGAAIYLGLCYLFKVEELMEIKELILKKIKR